MIFEPEGRRETLPKRRKGSKRGRKGAGLYLSHVNK